MMMSSIMMAKTTGTSLSQGGSGVMKGVAAFKASATARRPIVTRWEPLICEERSSPGGLHRV